MASRNLLKAVAGLSLILGGALLKGEVPSQTEAQLDTWAVGPITAISAPDGKLELRAIVLPHGSLVAKMNLEIEGATKGMDPGQKATTEEEIKKTYQERLQKEKTAAIGAEEVLCLTVENPATLQVLPREGIGQFAFLREELGRVPGTHVGPIQAQAPTEKPVPDITPPRQMGTPPLTPSLRDFKEGERVIVGFDRRNQKLHTLIATEARPGPGAFTRTLPESPKVDEKEPRRY